MHGRYANFAQNIQNKHLFQVIPLFTIMWWGLADELAIVYLKFFWICLKKLKFGEKSGTIPPHHAPKKLHLLRMPNVSPNQVLYLRAFLQRRVIRFLIVASTGRAGAACDGRGFTWANIAEIASQDDSYWSGKTAKIRIRNRIRN